MNRHAHFREMLARRPELSPAENERLNEHLATCPDCRQTSDAYARQSALLRSLPIVAPPASLRAGVLRRVPESTPAAGRWTWQRPLLAVAPLIAALLVVAALAFIKGQGNPHQSASGPELQRSAIPTAGRGVTLAPSPAPSKRAASLGHRSSHRKGTTTQPVPGQQPATSFGPSQASGQNGSEHLSLGAAPPAAGPSNQSPRTGSQSNAGAGSAKSRASGPGAGVAPKNPGTDGAAGAAPATPPMALPTPVPTPPVMAPPAASSPVPVARPSPTPVRNVSAEAPHPAPSPTP